MLLLQLVILLAWWTWPRAASGAPDANESALAARRFREKHRGNAAAKRRAFWQHELVRMGSTGEEVHIPRAWRLVDSLLGVGHALLMDTEAERIAQHLFQAQAKACPGILETSQVATEDAKRAYKQTDGSIMMNTFDGVSFAAPVCLSSAGKEFQDLVRKLHGELRKLARFLLKVLAGLQSAVEGAAAATWLEDALRADMQYPKRLAVLRSMGYMMARRGADAWQTQYAQSDGRLPQWTEQGPHLDPSWISLIVESQPGLLTQSAGFPSDWKSANSFGGVIILVGVRLSKASRGFYLPGCHGVGAPADRPRFSFAMLYTCGGCSFLDPDVRDFIMSCGITQELMQSLSPGGYRNESACSDALFPGCIVPVEQNILQ